MRLFDGLILTGIRLTLRPVDPRIGLILMGGAICNGWPGLKRCGC